MTVNTDAFQYRLSAVVRFTFEDVADGKLVSITPFPGSTVVGGALVIETAFDSGTSDEITVGDATDPDRYLGATDVQSTGLTDLVPTGFVYESVESIDVSLASVGTAATAGEGYIRVDMVLEGRENENAS